MADQAAVTDLPAAKRRRKSPAPEVSGVPPVPADRRRVTGWLIVYRGREYPVPREFASQEEADRWLKRFEWRMPPRAVKVPPHLQVPPHLTVPGGARPKTLPAQKCSIVPVWTVAPERPDPFTATDGASEAEERLLGALGRIKDLDDINKEYVRDHCRLYMNRLRAQGRSPMDAWGDLFRPLAMVLRDTAWDLWWDLVPSEEEWLAHAQQVDASATTAEQSTGQSQPERGAVTDVVTHRTLHEIVCAALLTYGTDGNLVSVKTLAKKHLRCDESVVYSIQRADFRSPIPKKKRRVSDDLLKVLAPRLGTTYEELMSAPVGSRVRRPAKKSS